MFNYIYSKILKTENRTPQLSFADNNSIPIITHYT